MHGANNEQSQGWAPIVSVFQRIWSDWEIYIEKLLSYLSIDLCTCILRLLRIDTGTI